MRDKFSELIEKGVASFEYTPICDEVPTPCPLCREYNNIWGLISDTHMAVAGDGNTYITGRLVSNTNEWSTFKFAGYWGNVSFKETGYWCLNDFLYKHGVEVEVVNLNGDVALKIVDRSTPEEDACCPTCCVAMESGINKPLATLTIDRNEDTLKECFNGNIYNVVENLNSNCMIKGTNWIVVGKNIYGKVDDKIIML